MAGVEVDEVAVLVRLRGLDEVAVLVVGEILPVDVFQEGERLGLVIEVGLGEHAVVDEDFQVVPLAFEVLAVVLEEGGEAVADFLGDVGRDLLDVGVALQVAAADVQGDVGRVDHAVEQGEEVGHDVLDLVGDVDLVAVELYFVAVELNVALDFGEVEHAGKVEWVVHVEVDPEEGLVGHGVEVAVEFLVVLFFQLGGFARP